MKQDENQIDKQRRDFLTGAAAIGLGSAVIAAVPTTRTALAEKPQEAKEQAGSKGYQLTQHVLDYYKSATS